MASKSYRYQIEFTASNLDLDKLREACISVGASAVVIHKIDVDISAPEPVRSDRSDLNALLGALSSPKTLEELASEFPASRACISRDIERLVDEGRVFAEPATPHIGSRGELYCSNLLSLNARIARTRDNSDN